MVIEQGEAGVENRISAERLLAHLGLTTYSISLRCKSMRDLVDQLCSPECAGRRPGTPGGEAARAIVVDALRDAGLDPYEQRVPRCGGANVLAKIRGQVERYVLVGAHFDHLEIGRASCREGVELT